MASISIALSKGRIFDETAPLLARVGIRPRADPESSRKLVIGTNRRDLRLVVVRASDTPTYVQHGGADLGIAGRDVLAEHGGEGLYQPVDLGIARCRMMVAVRKGFDYEGAVRRGARLRVATKFVNITREHFAAKGVHVDLIRLYGSMELAPLTGLADAIVDLVDTGEDTNTGGRIKRLRPFLTGGAADGTDGETCMVTWGDGVGTVDLDALLAVLDALAEIRAGRKRSHWMWFIFPQIAGLGSSPTSRFFAIKSRAEAQAYLAHPVLGPRLIECARAVLELKGRPPSDIFGYPDDLKLKSSVTLFAAVSAAGSEFQQVLDTFFNGEADAATIQLLDS